MSHHDPISDLLTRMRNSIKQRYKYVDVPLSKQSHSIAKALEEQGFVGQILTNKEQRKIRIFLRYGKGLTPVIQGLKRISKPGMSKYVGYKEIPTILGGMGMAILSTPQGIINGEAAKNNKVGGELLCYVW